MALRSDELAYGGGSQPSGSVNLRVVKDAEPQSSDFVKDRKLSKAVLLYRLRNARHFLRGYWKILVARALHISHVEGSLRLKVIRATGEELDLGIVSHRLVTDAGVAYLVDALQNLTEPENLKFHGIGTGGTAEAATQTALVTELTTQYNPDNTRATGSTTENAANVYRTVGTNTVDAAVAITEHAIFSQAATGGGTMLDRSLFSAVNLASGDRLESTYDLTINSGG